MAPRLVSRPAGVLIATLALLVAACSAAGSGGDPIDAGPVDGDLTTATGATATTRIPAFVPTSAEDLEISVDPAGRPYEVGYDPSVSVVDPRFATVLEVDQRVVPIDGEGLFGDPEPAFRVAEELRLPGVERLRLTILWETPAAPGATPDRAGDADGAGAGDPVERPVGLRLVRPGATVVEWSERRTAFVGRSPFGVVTVPGVIDRATAAFRQEDRPLIAPPSVADPVVVADLDERPGRETVVLAIGADRDAPEPLLSIGRDGDGAAVGLVILDPGVAWRIAVPDGTPPPDVTEREEQLIDCIEGRRLIDKWGHCI